MNRKPDRVWDPSSVPSFWINHASRLLMRRFEQRLRPLGFGMAYLPVVLALEESGPLQQKELAARRKVEQPTMAALLTRMERDGLVRREAHPSDGRASMFSLTPRGKKRVPEAKKLLAEEAACVTAGFTKEETAAFMGFLRRAVHNLGEDPRFDEDT